MRKRFVGGGVRPNGTLILRQRRAASASGGRSSGS